MTTIRSWIRGQGLQLSAEAADARTRGIVALAVAFSQAGLFFGGAVATFYLPNRSRLEWLLLVVLGGLSSLLCVAAIREQSRNSPARQAVFGLLVILVAIIGYLQRVYFAYHGPLLDDPHLSAFRPVIPFYLLIAIGAFALTRTAWAMKVIWTVHLISSLLALSGLVQHEHITLDRDGVVVLLVWIFLVAPLFILQLYAIPLYEDAFKRTKDELQVARETALLTRQLRESENRFRMVVHGLQVGIWDYQRSDGQEQHWWSDRFMEVLGYAPGELLPSSEAFTNLVHPEDREAVRRTAQEPNDKAVSNLNARLLTKTQGYRWFNLRTHWQRDAQGRSERAAGAISDIHDRLQAEADLKAAQKDLMHLAFHDALTGIGNRRAFDDRLENELARSRRNKAPLSLLLLDLDYFKRFNDRYGHPAGDDCLRLVAACIQKQIRRPADFVGRIGGEEFGAILPETSLSGAQGIAQSILLAIRELKIPHEESPLGMVSMSIGIGCTSAQVDTAPVLFASADRALYRAKDAGRNAVCSDEA